jgi:hypothetical protein
MTQKGWGRPQINADGADGAGRATANDDADERPQMDTEDADGRKEPQIDADDADVAERVTDGRTTIEVRLITKQDAGGPDVH